VRVVCHRPDGFAIHRHKQEARRDVAVRRVALDEAARHHDEHVVDVFGLDAVVHFGAYARDDGRHVDEPLEPLGGERERAGEFLFAEVLARAVALFDDELVLYYLLGHLGARLLALLLVLVAVDDVIFGDSVVAALHERGLHEVLNVLYGGDECRVTELDVYDIHDGLGYFRSIRVVAVAERGREGFLHRESYFGRVEVGYLAVALLYLLGDGHKPRKFHYSPRRGGIGMCTTHPKTFFTGRQY